VWQVTPVGQFDAWPSGGGGFEYFYGFIGGETHQYYPALFEGTTPIEPPKTPEQSYHLTEDLATKASKWVRQQKFLMPHKPFFAYSAFAYDGGGLGKGGKITLYLDGKKIGDGRVERTEPLIFSADETCDIGFESGSPVTSDYSTKSFSGVVNWVEIDIDNAAENLDHLIKPEQRLAISMAIQWYPGPQSM
jgi:hypothetical protein